MQRILVPTGGALGLSSLDLHGGPPEISYLP